MADTATLQSDPSGNTAENWGLTAVKTALAPGGRAYDLPFMKTAGFSDSITLLQAEKGLVLIEWQADAPLNSYDGIIHGGMQTALADIAQGHAFSTLIDAPCGFSTVDLTSRYLRPMPSGRTYQVETKVLESTRRTALIETVIRREDGKTVSRFLGNWQIVQREFQLKN